MHSVESESVQCPYCGEEIEIVIDCSVDDQEYIEDCSVCCRPIVFNVMADDGEVISLDARTEDE